MKLMQGLPVAGGNPSSMPLVRQKMLPCLLVNRSRVCYRRRITLMERERSS
jgi:hypothetical protein